MLRELSKIILWKNILTILLLLCFLKFFFLDNFGFITPLNSVNFFLLLVAIISIFIGSSCILLYFSNELELKTKTDKQFLKFYMLFSFIGVCIGTYISFQIERPENSLIFLLACVFMFFYAKETFKKTLINNFVSAFLKPGTLIILWWIDAPLILNTAQWKIFLNLEIIFIYVIAVSFIANFVKSIFIDIVNIKKDILNQHRTLPITLGTKAALKLVLQITIIAIIASNSMIVYLIGKTFIPLLVFLFLIIPQVYGCIKIKKAKTQKDYIFMIKVINVGLLAGAFIFPLVAYYLT